MVRVVTHLSCPVFDRSAMQGCRGEYIIYFSIKVMSMQRSSSEDRTTGWFFLERSPIFWIEKVIYSCICSDLTAVVRRILTAIYGQNTVRMVEYSQCAIHGSLTANPTTIKMPCYKSTVYCIHSAKSLFENVLFALHCRKRLHSWSKSSSGYSGP